MTADTTSAAANASNPAAYPPVCSLSMPTTFGPRNPPTPMLMTLTSAMPAAPAGPRWNDDDNE